MKIFERQAKQRQTKKDAVRVRQDKSGFPTAHTATNHAAHSSTPNRAEHLNSKSHRSQARPIVEPRIMPLTLWVEPRVKSEIVRRVTESGGKLTMSSVGGALLKKGLQVDLDVEYGALLTPVFEDVLKRYMKARDNRLATLLVYAYVTIEQTKNLTVNVLGRQPKLSVQALNNILDRSYDDAKKKLIHRNPELKELVKELNAYLLDQEKPE